MNTIYDKIRIATNNAIDARKTNNNNKFIRAINELNELEFDRKSDLINMICYDGGYKDTDYWIDDFLLNDINKSDDVLSITNAFIFFLNAGKNYSIEYYQKLVLSIIERIGYDNADFYKLRQIILNSTHFEIVDCVPIFYKIEGYHNLPLIELSNSYPLIDLIFNDEKKEVEIEEFDIEFTDDEIENAIIEEEFENKSILDLFIEEENLFSSFFVSENQQLEILEKIKFKSSKAWYFLLKLKKTETKYFFN